MTDWVRVVYKVSDTNVSLLVFDSQDDAEAQAEDWQREVFEENGVDNLDDIDYMDGDEITRIMDIYGIYERVDWLDIAYHRKEPLYCECQ